MATQYEDELKRIFALVANSTSPSDLNTEINKLKADINNTIVEANRVYRIVEGLAELYGK